MKIAQQIVGVNQRLGNTAVPNMQGTTRMIYDSAATNALALDQTFTFFANASSRTFPQTNLNNNRFEVGESLAIQGLTVFWAPTITTTAQVVQPNANSPAAYTYTQILNFFIGNQRIIKDLEVGYYRTNLGETITAGDVSNVITFETPLIIPPQVEFYATIRLTSSDVVGANSTRMYLAIFGQGTLLNTKSTF
jgi:hypothetical protein